MIHSGLLRRLLASLEHATIQMRAPLGVTLEPAHRARARARARRQSVGLSDTPGLLVTDALPAGAAAVASIEPGDLLVALDGTATLSEAHLHRAMNTAGPTVTLHLLRGDQPITPTADLAP